MAGMTASSIENAVRYALDPGEDIASFASALAGPAPNALEAEVLVLTSRRLMVLSPAPQTEGYELKSAQDRSSCSLVNEKTLPDGSRILIIRQKGGLLYVHLSSSWDKEADAIRDALSTKAVAAPQPVAELPIDRFALFQEFAGLSAALESNKEEEE